MAGPWEQFSSESGTSGPWEKFGAKPDREAIRQQIENDPISQGARNFAKDMPFTEQFSAGMGKAFTDLGRGAAQLVNAGPSGAEVTEQRKLDAPLMGTGGGMTGNVAGNVAALAPAAFIPGVNTVAGAGAMGAVLGGLQPTQNVGERLGNMALGGGVGAGAQFAGSTGARMLGERAAKKEALAKAMQQKNAVKDETIRQAREAGYVFPPSATTDSFLGKRLESIAGKAALGQESAIRNQKVTDTLARRVAGLADDEAISQSTLEAARNRMAQPYREVAALSPRADMALTSWKESNQMAKKYYQAYERLPLPSLEARADRALNAARMAEQTMEAEALAAGRPDLVQALKQARVQLAKNFDVGRAVNVGSGEVDASVIGRMLDAGKPLTDELATIGRTQQAFRPYMREGGLIPTPGVSKSEALASGLLGTIGGASAGPAGVLAGGLPLLSGPARSALLSGPVQNAISGQSYGPGMMTREMAMLNDPASRERLAALMRSLALPAAAQTMGAEQ